MRALFVRWLNLDAQNFIPEVWAAVGVLWVLLVVFAIMSIRSQSMTARSKILWGLFVIAVPFVGLFIYCVYCLARVDYYMFEFLLFRRRKRGVKQHRTKRATGEA